MSTRCDVCRRLIGLMADGRIKGHVFNPNTAGNFVTCSGSGQRPAREGQA